MKLFIVEDDGIQSLILEMMVKKLGLNHIGTESYGEKAIKKIIELRPDIILLDVMLKDSVNGIDVAKRVKEIYDPVIIYISGNSDDRHVQRAEQHGFHEFITKPVTIHQLRQSIDSIQVY